MIIGIRTHFDAAHYLPHHTGKCKNMHGHRWVVEVEFEGPLDGHSGMVLDFSLLKDLVGQTIDELDHTVLNEHSELPNPTAELITAFLKKRFQGAMYRATLYSITIYETPDSWARIINP